MIFVTYGYLYDDCATSKTFIRAHDFYRLMPSCQKLASFSSDEMVRLDLCEDNPLDEENLPKCSDYRIVLASAARRALCDFIRTHRGTSVACPCGFTEYSVESSSSLVRLDRAIFQSQVWGYEECDRVLHGKASPCHGCGAPAIMAE